MWSGSSFVFHCSSSRARAPLLSVVLQCHVVRFQSFNFCRTHHWKMRCKPGRTDMTTTSRIDHQLVLLYFPLTSQIGTRLFFPIHFLPTFLAVFQQKKLRVPHLRIQSCSLDINLAPVWTCLNLEHNHRLVDCCHSHWFLSTWISTFPCPCLYLEICSSACTNNQMLCVHTFHSFDIHLRIASVLLSFPGNLRLSGFLFLTTLLAFAGFFLPFPFQETGSTSIESSACVFSRWIRLEDASAPQLIINRHA